MTEKIYNWIKTILFIIIGITLTFLIILSFDAANESEAWKFLDFDFSNKDNIISAYGGLLAAILSFITILFVILDLVYQRRSITIQEEQKIIDRNQSFKDRMKEIHLLISSTIENITAQGTIGIEYSNKEKEDPTAMNVMSFLPNTFPRFILETDRLTTYNAFRELKPGEEWQKSYINLFKMVDFYDKSIPELITKHQIHLDKKYKHSSKISDLLDDFLDEINKKLNKYITHSVQEQHLWNHDFIDLLQNVKHEANQILREKNLYTGEGDVKNPASIEAWYDRVLQNYFNGILDLMNTSGDSSFDQEVSFNQAQQLLRLIDHLIQDSLDYANHLYEYYTAYFTTDSNYITQFIKIKNELENL